MTVVPHLKQVPSAISLECHKRIRHSALGHRFDRRPGCARSRSGANWQGVGQWKAEREGENNAYDIEAGAPDCTG